MKANLDELIKDLEGIDKIAVSSLSQPEIDAANVSVQELRRIAWDYVEYLIHGLSKNNRLQAEESQLPHRIAELAQHRLPAEVLMKIANNCANLCMERLEKVSLEGWSAPNFISRFHRVALEGSGMIARIYMQQKEIEFSWFLNALEEIEAFPSTLASLTDADTLLKSGLNKLKGIIAAEEGAIVMGENAKTLRWTQSDFKWVDPQTDQPLELDPYAAEKLYGCGVTLEVRESDGSMPCLNKFRRRLRSESIILVPMRIRDITIGLIILSKSRGSRPFTERERRLAALFANGLAKSFENVRLHASEQQKIKNTVALLEIARVINSTLDLETMTKHLARMIVDLVGAEACAIFLMDSEKERLLPKAVCGSIAEEIMALEGKGELRVAQMNPGRLRLLSGGNTVIVSAPKDNDLFDEKLLEERGVQGMVIHPLLVRENLIGMLVIFQGRKVEEIGGEEKNVIAAIGSQAAIAIENAILYEDIEKSYFSTVKALAKAIEVKDPYTHGHSERVTEYALMIAEEMGLDDREKQNIKYAATLHDIGKIGIAGKVLNKPGALTDEEYMHVKTHPLLGDTIVEPVEFLQGPRPLILHHHERYDGRGYPDGLKGEEIPLGARIITVADSFEAMRSDRPYRKALTFEDAKSELIRNAGTQFDPHVVETFLKILEREGTIEVQDMASS